MNKTDIVEQAIVLRIDDILVRNRRKQEKDTPFHFRNSEEQKSFETYQEFLNTRTLNEMICVYREAFLDGMRLCLDVFQEE